MVGFYILMPDTQEILEKVLLKLFDLFLKRGGRFKKQDIHSISFTSDNKPVLKTDLESYSFDKAVVACGAFSKRLTDQVDEKIPLDTETRLSRSF